MQRADKLLFEKGLAKSRSAAQTLINEKKVLCRGRLVLKPSELLEEDDELTVTEPQKYVSRGGLKLEHALRVFGVSVKDDVCADIGASTGGFTQVLLKQGAKRVYAVDVGYNLLAWKLRNDERVRVMERTNARMLRPGDIPESLDLGVTDVSFISLKAILPPVFRLLAPDADFVALIKPQFEAQKEEVGEKGVVRDQDTHIKVVSDIVVFCRENGFSPVGLDFSPITGPEGNMEFLLHLKNRAGVGSVTEEIIRDTVCAAHVNFGV